jgi:hypothetical protein
MKKKEIRRKLPRGIDKKLQFVLEALRQGIAYQNFHGKRLRHNRNLISIPLGSHYRLLCWSQNHQVIPWAVKTHSEYNRYGKP